KPGDGRGAPCPLRRFHLELLPARACERVKPGAARVLGLSPFSIEPSRARQPLQRGKKRSRVHLEYAARDLLHPAGDAEAVHRLQTQGLENEHVQRALNHVCVRFVHRCLLDYLGSSWLSRCEGQEYEKPHHKSNRENRGKHKGKTRKIRNRKTTSEGSNKMTNQRSKIKN